MQIIKRGLAENAFCAKTPFLQAKLLRAAQNFKTAPRSAVSFRLPRALV